METLMIEWENTSELIKIIASTAIGAFIYASSLYAYIQKKGIKLASFDKVDDYRKLKEVVGVLTRNISRDEFLSIVAFVVDKKKSQTGFSAADAQTVGNMLIDAIATEEKKEA